MGSYSQPQWSSWPFSGIPDSFTSHNQYSNYPTYLADTLEAYQTHHDRLMQQQQMSRGTESKPRLSKEEVEILEAEFQKNHKPSSTTKKALAETMRVDNARINNWFQNRRAREKKENNIREYEAKQRLEKQRSEAGICAQPDHSRQLDLVVSSAPFPQPGGIKQSIESSQSPSDQSSSDSTNDASECSRAGDSVPLSPPRLVKREVEEDDDIDNHLFISDPLNNYFSMQDDVMSKASTGVTDGLSFSDYIMGQNVGQDHNGLFDAESPSTEASEARSPRGIDLASRRDRRPAHLVISGARSKSFTTRSFERRQVTPLRIGTAGISAGRVRKSVATPRSPFFDKSADALLQICSTSQTAGRTDSSAPPTPDTPVALQQQETTVPPLSALYSLNSKYSPPDVMLSDPTLRTPPTTPGYSDELYNLRTGYDMSISEENLMAPGMTRLSQAMDLTHSAAMFGSYGPNTPCSSQQMVPMFPSQIGQAYLNFMGARANAEYDWPDLSPSTASTVSSSQRYMNLGHMDR